MGDLTDNLSLHEFACRCNYPDCLSKESVDFNLVNVLQKAVDDFATRYNCRASITISGGNRCQKHNTDIEGHVKSKHRMMMAADHKLYVYPNGVKTQITPTEQYDYYNDLYPDKFGLGIYWNRCHLDVQPKRKRWDAS